MFYYHKFIRNLAHTAKPLTNLTHHDVKFAWTSSHFTAFNTLKSTPRVFKCCIEYTDASDDACEAQLLQEHGGQEHSVAFLLHTFTDTQWNWSTTDQEAYGIYYAVTKWNCYLQ